MLGVLYGISDVTVGVLDVDLQKKICVINETVISALNSFLLVIIMLMDLQLILHKIL